MKNIVFLTGTRADYGKIKALMQAVEAHEAFNLHVFVTGMHMLSKYGSTYKEILKDGFQNVYQFVNTRDRESMDITLSNTIVGFSNYVTEFKPDLIIVHGDRVEALAGAIVGALNNIKVAHIEGGEISGTIDESIRHAVTKFSHLHLVANEQAAKHVIQLGERKESVFPIGSPDIDIMNSTTLPSLESVKERYDISFDSYSILMFHPITTEVDSIQEQINEVVQAALESDEFFIVVYPNNDEGNQYIFDAYKKLIGHPRFQLYPSLRFEYFLTLLKHANMLIGNSSAGIREAGVYATPAIDIGNRQKGRYNPKETPHVLAVPAQVESIKKAIKKAGLLKLQPESNFGEGDSVQNFIEVLENQDLWNYPIQKQFIPR